MADSTTSDADKIRAKRLARLGGATNEAPPAASSTSSQAAGERGSTPSPSQQEPQPQQSSQSATNPPQQHTSSAAPQIAAPRIAAPQIKNRPMPALPATAQGDGLSFPPPRPRPEETWEEWQDRTLRGLFRVTLKLEDVGSHVGHRLTFLKSTAEDLNQAQRPNLLTIDILEGAIAEAAGELHVIEPGDNPGTTFEYLLACFKRLSRTIRNLRSSGPEDRKAKLDVLKEARRLCMSYCVFSITMPEMFGNEETATFDLVDHLLANPESDKGICTDFLEEASLRIDDDEDLKELFVHGVEGMSRRLSMIDMLADYRPYTIGLRNVLRFPKIVDAITQSPMFAPQELMPQFLETTTILGPFFRLSPMQLGVARNYFSAPQTRDKRFIANAQGALRMTLRTLQSELFQIANSIATRCGPAPRERLLDWLALCVNKNHRKRAMRVDPKTVSSDGFMVNVTNVLDQLCEPFMDAQFAKIDRIDADYFRRTPRVDIGEETKINADQRAAEKFHGQKAEGTNNFISELFFLTVAAHHYGTEAAQDGIGPRKKTVKRMEQDLQAFEADRHKYINDSRYLWRFDEQVNKMKKSIEDTWSMIHATHGVICDDLNQARSMQFMRYVTVWVLRLASGQDLPKQQLQLPLPETQPEVFKCLPEYFLEDIVDNFKFITGTMPQIITPQQCDELIQVCIAFLRNTEYVKNPGVKHGLVTILFYGCQPMPNAVKGLLGNILIGSPFAHKHLLHALMKFYIEAENTGTHTQFYDKFNIRYEIFQVIKCIWINTMYRENLSREAKINTQFFVQFVNMIVNDATFVLDESLSGLSKLHDLHKEIDSAAFRTLPEAESREKTENLESTKRQVKSYMGLMSESMETLKLFTEALPGPFTMPQIVQRLAAMLDYNLDILVGDRRQTLRVPDMHEYNFDPRALLQDLVTVYLHLQKEPRFVEGIAMDGRSYKAVNFDKAAIILKRKTNIEPEKTVEWQKLGYKVGLMVDAQAQEEQDLGDIPEDFQDPLILDLMKDPVILPASQMTVDRSTIEAHLLSDSTDPFNRAPLKIEDVVPNTERKKEIEKWKADMVARKRNEQSRAAAAAAGVASIRDDPMDTSQD